MEQEEILFINKKTGKVMYSITPKQQVQGIIFSMILTPIIVLGLLFILDKSGILEFVIKKIKFVLSFYF